MKRIENGLKRIKKQIEISYFHLDEVLFFKNLTEESKTLFEGATGIPSRRFSTCEDDLTVFKTDWNCIQNGLERIQNGMERIGNRYTLILTLYIFHIFGKLTMCRNEF